MATNAELGEKAEERKLVPLFENLWRKSDELAPKGVLHTCLLLGSLFFVVVLAEPFIPIVTFQMPKIICFLVAGSLLLGTEIFVGIHPS